MNRSRVFIISGAVLGAAIVVVLLLLVMPRTRPGWWRTAEQPDGVDSVAANSSTAIERGKYLAIAGNCVSCHTRSGGVPFSGGRPFTTPFGTIYSSNITPDPATGIGNWTQADLRRAMHEGIARGGYRLFPAFPYTSFTKVHAQDVDAIYAYLRTVGPERYSPPANDFVFKQRWSLSLWNALFFKAGPFEPDPHQPPEWNRGAYLVEGLGHCGACHRPRNVFMAEVSSDGYTGGIIQDSVTEGLVRHWSGVNLTAAKTGLAAWSLRQLEQYLKTGFSARAGTFGPMNEVIVNSLKNLRDEDIHAIAFYLRSLAPRELRRGTVSRDTTNAGATIYKEHCEECHLASGRGGVFGGPPVAGSTVVQADDPASLINVILYAPKPPKEISFGSWETMEAYNDVLSDADVAAVCNYMRGSWGNTARNVTPSDVAKQR